MLPESLACLAVRLGLDFKATSWLDRDAERVQVERHMRLCLRATDGFRTMVTISPSEPLLAEASWEIMRKWLSRTEAPKALLRHISDSYLNAGSRGEVVGALLLLLARDKAIQDRKIPEPLMENMSPADLKRDGLIKGRILTAIEFLDALLPTSSHTKIRKLKPIRYSHGYNLSTPLQRAFSKANIYFTHFIKVHDFEMVNREYLWGIFCRGAAIICANNQRGVDIIVPMLMGTILRPECITAILIQIKNDGSFTNNMYTPLFDMMDPLEVNLFSENDAKTQQPPILRIVFALASERSGVAVRVPGDCRSPRSPVDKFTSYDFWIAGVSTESFGVIPDEQTSNLYRLLLDRTRNVFDGYNEEVAKAGDKPNKGRIHFRRMMHAAAAPSIDHFQNFVNLDSGRTTGDYSARDYLSDDDGDEDRSNNMKQDCPSPSSTRSSPSRIRL